MGQVAKYMGYGMVLEGLSLFRTAGVLVKPLCRLVTQPLGNGTRTRRVMWVAAVVFSQMDCLLWGMGSIVVGIKMIEGDPRMGLLSAMIAGANEAWCPYGIASTACFVAEELCSLCARQL